MATDTTNTQENKELDYIKTFKDKNDHYGILTEDHLDILNDKQVFNLPLYESPASADKYGMYANGLVEYTLRVTGMMFRMNKNIDEKNSLSSRSIIKTGFLHAIGRTGMFIPNDSKWHIEKLGKYYKFADNNVTLKTSERTLFIIQKHLKGVDLEVDEYQAIINFDKTDEAYLQNHAEILTHLLRSAVSLTIAEMRKEHEVMMNVNK